MARASTTLLVLWIVLLMVVISDVAATPPSHEGGNGIDDKKGPPNSHPGDGNENQPGKGNDNNKDNQPGKGNGNNNDNQPGKGNGNNKDNQPGKGNGNNKDNQPGKGNGNKGNGNGNQNPPDHASPPDSSDASGENRYAPPPPIQVTPGPPSSPSTSPKKAKCKSTNYPQCYATEHVCPISCPSGCEVDCVSCKPVCSCDSPGAVCQDPRFIGGDGITFYFHGKKDRDFCIVTDPNLHINAHFIGRRNKDMKRDFTWVQSIGILFDNHKLYIGAEKTATWNDAIDRLSLTFDDEPILLPDSQGARWKSDSVPMTSVMRISDANSVVVEVEGIFRITAKVVPITKEESRVHNYGITQDDCFAHLELGFKFFSLSDEVNGVLGQTYGTNYVSRVKMGVLMPVMGGEREFKSSNIFATDCSVAKFQDGKFSSGLLQASSLRSELPGLKCYSGIDGRGVVCKR